MDDSDRTIRLARRYRYESTGIHSGRVMPWADVVYRLRTWHGISVNLTDLRDALNPVTPPATDPKEKTVRT